MMFNEIYNKLENEIKELFNNAKGSHDWEHTERVIKIALRLDEKEEGSKTNIVKYSALLHDIGRIKDEKGKCHAEQGAGMIDDILSKYNLEKEFVESIKSCIRKHSYRRGEILETIEEKIVFDADKLDGIGAIGIGRSLFFSGECGAKVHNNNIDIFKTEAYSKEDTAYREYMVKLRYIKDKLFTEEAKRIAKGRHEFMEEFFDRLNKEVEGLL